VAISQRIECIKNVITRCTVNTLSNALLCLSGVTSEDPTGDGVVLEKNRKTDLFQLQKVNYLLTYLAYLTGICFSLHVLHGCNVYI